MCGFSRGLKIRLPAAAQAAPSGPACWLLPSVPPWRQLLIYCNAVTTQDSLQGLIARRSVPIPALQRPLAPRWSRRCARCGSPIQSRAGPSPQCGNDARSRTEPPLQRQRLCPEPGPVTICPPKSSGGSTVANQTRTSPQHPRSLPRLPTTAGARLSACALPAWMHEAVSR